MTTKDTKLNFKSFTVSNIYNMSAQELNECNKAFGLEVICKDGVIKGFTIAPLTVKNSNSKNIH